MPAYEMMSGTLVEARLITQENKEDITEWCQDHSTYRTEQVQSIVGNKNIGDYVVQFDFGFVVMAKDVFEVFYKEKK